MSIRALALTGTIIYAATAAISAAQDLPSPERRIAEVRARLEQMALEAQPMVVIAGIRQIDSALPRDPTRADSLHNGECEHFLLAVAE